MKNKIIGTLCLLLIAFYAQAQTEKGNFLVGGDFRLGLGFGNGITSYNLGVNPNVGYFVKDNLALGLRGQMNLGGSRSHYSESYGVSGFGRYYIETKKNKIRPFVQGELGYEHTNVKTPSEMFDFKDNYLKASGAAGVAFFLNEHVSLELSARYDYRNNFGGAQLHNFGGNIGFQIHLGGKKKKE